MDLKKNLEKYAELIVKIGLNLKEGDNLQITFNEWGLDLVRQITDKAYELGVGDVILNFTDDAQTLSFYNNAKDVTYFPDFKADYLVKMAEHNYHRLVIAAADPSLLKDVDPQKVSEATKIRSIKTKKVSEYTMSNYIKWCIAAVPSPAWASSVFPDSSQDEAVAKLWENIFMATRVDTEDPVAAWHEHDSQLKKHEAYLNEAGFEKLIYRGPGTDLEVYLVQDHVWVGGSSTSKGGDVFFANIPTEEVFTMPDRSRVNGTLKATMPLALRGQLVEDFRFVFKDGEVIEVTAAKGQDVFEKLLETDEGAKRLGEVALVAHNSPISNTGILFRNTLFDENASCHFAVGAAYSENVKNGENLTEDEKLKVGMNDSLIHVDFMVGGEAVTVTGVKPDGTEIVLLSAGNWQI
ncbi:MAG: aminopeptidase [Clostridiaceae bacterium]